MARGAGKRSGRSFAGGVGATLLVAVTTWGGGAADPQAFQAVVNSDSFIQGLCYGLEDDAALYVRNRERADPSQRWQEAVHRFPAPFELLCVASRLADDFFVLGRDAEGLQRIERWRLSTPEGAHFMVRQPGARARVEVRGGVYMPPAARRAPPELARTELLRGAPGAWIALEPDPDARFVLLLAREGERASLHRLDLGVGAAPVLLLASEELPALRQMDSIDTRDHRERGRVYHLVNTLGPYAVDLNVLLHDADRDGWPDPGSAEVLTHEELRAAGYLGDVWAEDFVNLRAR